MTGWDWTGIAASTAATVVLSVCVAIGDSWPGSEVVLVLAVVVGGLGLSLLLPARPPAVGDDDVEVTQ